MPKDKARILVSRYIDYNGKKVDTVIANLVIETENDENFFPLETIYVGTKQNVFSFFAKYRKLAKTLHARYEYQIW